MELKNYIGKSATFEFESKLTRCCYQKLLVVTKVKDISTSMITLDCTYLFMNGDVFDTKIQKLKLQGDKNTKYFKLHGNVHVLSNFD